MAQLVAGSTLGGHTSHAGPLQRLEHDEQVGPAQWGEHSEQVGPLHCGEQVEQLGPAQRGLHSLQSTPPQWGGHSEHEGPVHWLAHDVQLGPAQWLAHESHRGPLQRALHSHALVALHQGPAEPVALQLHGREQLAPPQPNSHTHVALPPKAVMHAPVASLQPQSGTLQSLPAHSLGHAQRPGRLHTPPWRQPARHSGVSQLMPSYARSHRQVGAKADSPSQVPVGPHVSPACPTPPALAGAPPLGNAQSGTAHSRPPQPALHSHTGAVALPSLQSPCPLQGGTPGHTGSVQLGPVRSGGQHRPSVQLPTTVMADDVLVVALNAAV